MPRHRYLPIAGAGLLAAVMSVSAPAGAARVTPTPTVDGAAYDTGPPAVTSASSVSAQITVPRIRCTAGETSAIDPLVEVYGSTVNSNDDAQAGIRLVCTDGAPSYQPQLLVDNVRTFPALAVARGAVIWESVTESASAATATLTDDSTGQSVTATGTGDDTVSTGLVGATNVLNPDGARESVPDFGEITFSDASINDRTIGSLTWGSENFYAGQGDPPAANADLLASVSKLVDGGAEFKVRFRASS